jgi:hypothetical protein
VFLGENRGRSLDPQFSNATPVVEIQRQKLSRSRSLSLPRSRSLSLSLSHSLKHTHKHTDTHDKSQGRKIGDLFILLAQAFPELNYHRNFVQEMCIHKRSDTIFKRLIFITYKVCIHKINFKTKHF